MDLTFLKVLYAERGPYTTVVIPTGKHTETGTREVALTWRALAEQLGETAADDDLAALDREVTGVAVGDSPETLLLVAADGEVVLRQELPEPPLRAVAVHGPLPHLTELVRQGSRRVPHVVVVADRLGGAIRVFGQFDEELVSRSVSGDDLHINKVKVGGWTHLRYLHRTENTWEHNAALVARDVNALARVARPQLILLAGDVRARGLVSDALEPPVRDLVTVVEHPGAAEPREDVVDSYVRDAARAAARAVTEQLAQEIGRGGAGVSGLAETAFAFQRAQVDTLLLDMAFLTDPPQVDARSTGLGFDGPAPADDAMVAAAVLTGAQLLVSDEPTDLADNCGALLRYGDEGRR